MSDSVVRFSVVVSLASSVALPACGDADAGASTTYSTGASASTNPASETSASMSGADSSAPGSSSESSTETETGGLKFDTMLVPDAGAGQCDTQGGAEAQSFIWIGNSLEDTMSKINTKTLVEEGRYKTQEVANWASPSRTSVNLAGDVAVANRYAGGVTKVIALPENCDEMRNGIPGLQTSTGTDDVLAWGMDDCVDWNTDLGLPSNRPIAWTPGTIDPQTCRLVGAKVWTAGIDQGPARAFRLDGETGTVEAEVTLTGFTVNGYGPYGGAVDAQENFWVVSQVTGNLARVDAESLEVSVWEAPIAASYGIAIDEYGRLWISGLYGHTDVFDPETETFTTLEVSGTGLGQSANGIMWIAGTPPTPQGAPLFGWDIETLEPYKTIYIPGVLTTRGVSVDSEGYVWMVEWGSRAMKIDPVAETYDTFAELHEAYTYSDMTGNALSLVAGVPAG